MAGEIDIKLPALEVLAGTVADYGRSGASLDFPVFAAGGSAGIHGEAALAVPMQTLFALAGRGATAAGALVVPRQSVSGYGGAAGAMAVPMQTFSGAATFPLIWRAELVVPAQVVSGDVRVGSLAGGALKVPIQALSTRMGGRAALVVPRPEVAAHAIVGGVARPALLVPMQQLSGSCVVFSYSGSAALVVPIIQPGPYGIGRLVVPMPVVSGVGALPATAADFEAWVMNLRNGGVTHFTSYPFVQFTRQGNKTYAVGQDGNLYVLGGDTDNGAPIAWAFQTGLDELGTPAKKHVPYLYMQGLIDGVVEIQVTDDRNRVFAYEYDTKDRGAVHLTHRRKLGNGIRTVNLGFGMRSTKGAYIELDWLGPEITNTQRNI